ncbi:putative secreted protein [Streptomyces davaonensis JCM 4913]|uniref:Putative secreted protein n=1 Tax=Streptomyces davaonensis (strain DSM 101723 / JCM 4913 / KCC S-0913 / 768) TaxID=1214101 RepID=K4QTL6_STRDJ|nr:hypothetical protein [Streptomyces davaonensis]CCK26616.1 putative secreted protein [Streptomyces davaonensis JCM 4913]
MTQVTPSIGRWRRAVASVFVASIVLTVLGLVGLAQWLLARL